MIVCAAVAAPVVFLNRASKDSGKDEELLKEGHAALSNRDFAAARKIAERLLLHDSANPQALLLAGGAAMGVGAFPDAVDFYRRVPAGAGEEALPAHFAAGEILLTKMMRLSEAEEQFRQAVKADPEYPGANRRLAFVLGLQNRTWESIPYRLEILSHSGFVAEEVYALCKRLDAGPGEEGFVSVEHDRVSIFSEFDPSDPGPQLALVDLGMGVNERKKTLERIVRSHPNLIEAWIKLGRSYADSGSEAEFLKWDSTLPSGAPDHPELWAVRAAWARRQSDIPVAIRCYWESARRNPNSVRVTFQLGQLLANAGEASSAAVFLERSQVLQQYEIAAKKARHGKDAAALENAARLADSLGLLWEAYGWARLCLAAEKREPPNTEIAALLEKVRPRLLPHPKSREHSEEVAAARVDLSSHPLPAWQQAGDAPTATAEVSQVDGEIRFEDRAESVGIEFRYVNGHDPLRNGGMQWMYEATGGGTAVLDYDGDCWPDICFTQGSDWPPDASQRDDLDRLYRNLGGERFEDVTDAAGLVESRYSQGAAVGDFDSDGFPDLYAANIGVNRLFRNNGDGTFTDVTESAGLDDDRWTTSCLIADLNGDGLPDLYDVNYLAGENVFTLFCTGGGGKPGTCPPTLFEAAQDQAYLNRGDGSFEEVTEEAGFVAADGKGLGIVAADFDGSGRLSLFIANDMVPNFYFDNRTVNRGDRPRFSEQGMASGLALDQDGRAQACMGVAAGDADGDGRIDLYVSNFANESYTLYRNLGAGQFQDVTRQAGLREPSLPWLGFGTQFLDGDLDGQLDLIVVNGHITETGGAKPRYRMPPQFYRNLESGRFVELSARSLGPYFADKYLGRGLARLDWNRDGREDAAISHLDRPAALLTNTTPSAGGFLTVILRGVVSARDAVGATVTVATGERMLVRQMTAGDGYQASNQRILTFGLGRQRRIESLRVRWPSGLEQEFTGLDPDREVLLIEGASVPIQHPEIRASSVR